MVLASSIDHLPAELLLAIFRILFSSSYSICSPLNNNCITCRRINTHHVLWGPTESFAYTDPTLFPFAQAAVLPRWRALLATVPEYWTRPIFLLDDPPTPLTDIRDFLSYSNSLPIEVYITRRNFTKDPDPLEAQRVRDAIDALKPHLSRCQFLFIRVSRSSSLPSLRHDFTGDAPYLTQLKLQCDFDDGINPIAHTQPLPPQPFRCPALYTLLIDGPNFSQIAINHAKWWGASFNTLKSLIIRNLETDPLPFTSALASLCVRVLSDLRLLTLSNVSFDTSLDTTTTLPIYPFALQMLILSQTSFPFLAHFFRYTFLGDLYTIRIESCAFPPDSTTLITIPNTFSLTLKNITHPSHFISLLRTWGGRRLYIDTCPGFDNSILEMMSSPLRASTSNDSHALITPTTFACPNLSILHLTNCTNFTPSAITSLIDTRNNPDNLDLGAVVMTGVMELVTITGDTPEISEAEKNHFDEGAIVRWGSNSEFTPLNTH